MILERYGRMKDRAFRRTRNLSSPVLFGVLAVFLLIPFFAGGDATSAAKGETGSPFDSIKKTYAGITALEASFHQKIFVSGIKKIRDFDGNFYFKRHKGFLWKYTKPKGKTFLYDGHYMWQDEEGKTFVLKSKVSREKTGGTFFDLVEDIARIDNLFTVKQHSMLAGMQYFELLPKKDSTVNIAKIWIDKNNLLRKIEILEFTGNVNTIEFTDIKVNAPVSDSKFTYKSDGIKDVVER